MLQLDIRTSLTIATLVSLVPSLIAALIWKRGSTCPGFGRWTLGNLLGTLSLFFFSLRGAAPDWISIVVANALALAAAILFFQGIRLLRGLPLYWWPELLAAVSTIVLVIYFRYVNINLNARAVAMSAVLGSFGLSCGFTMLRQMPSGRRFGMALTGIVAILAGIANFFRMYFYAFVPVTDLLAPSSPNGAFFTGAGLAIVGWSFGFLLITDERLALGSAEVPAGADEIDVKEAASLSPKIVSEAEAHQQVQRIVESDVFRRSPRMERFLIVTVERALMGHPEELKEYALGRDVFNRGEDYDPRMDSIVRVEAQRLRRKLREYYASYGSNDPVIIEFYPGSYVPSFRYKEFRDSNSAS